MTIPAPSMVELRLPLFPFEGMSVEQQAAYEAILAGPRGRLIGPLRAALHNPELASRWSRLGELLRYDLILPARLKELAIIMVGRRWSSQIEWWVHSASARDAGLDEAVIDAIHRAQSPIFAREDEREIYEYGRTLQECGSVPADLHRRITDRWGARGAVELTALIGYYTMVCMTLNAHDIPLPDGCTPPFDGAAAGLVSLAPSGRVNGSAE